MSADRGAVAVARIDALPEIEAWLVRALRLWSDGATGQALLAADLTRRFGSARANTMTARFDDLMGLFLTHARRAPRRHSSECICVGADEAIFANFVTTAAVGEREDATLMAMLLLRAEVAPIAVSLAQTLGLDLRAGIGVAGRRLDRALH